MSGDVFEPVSVLSVVVPDAPGVLPAPSPAQPANAEKQSNPHNINVIIPFIDIYITFSIITWGSAPVQCYNRVSL